MNKKIIGIVIALIAVVLAVIGGAYAFDLFAAHTDFDNQFMSGTFQGEVSVNKVEKSKYSNWTASYTEKDKNITYNMSCVKQGSFITNLYMLQGMAAPETREFNGVDWKIFYSQAVPSTNDTNNSSSNSSETSDIIDVYICEADINDTTYMINVMSYGNVTQCDGSLYCDLFKNDIEPLLNSVTLKDAKKAPQMYKLLNMTKDEFEQTNDQINQILAGNVTVEDQ